MSKRLLDLGDVPPAPPERTRCICCGGSGGDGTAPMLPINNPAPMEDLFPAGRSAGGVPPLRRAGGEVEVEVNVQGHRREVVTLETPRTGWMHVRVNGEMRQRKIRETRSAGVDPFTRARVLSPVPHTAPGEQVKYDTVDGIPDITGTEVVAPRDMRMRHGFRQ